MTIYTNWEKRVSEEIQNPLLVVREGLNFTTTPCYASWWSTTQRRTAGLMRTLVYESALTPGQVVTLQNAAMWAQDFGLDIRVVQVNGAKIGGTSKPYPVYAMEVAYGEEEQSDFLFYKLCHSRYPAHEFTNWCGLPDATDYRGLLARIFKRAPGWQIHMPFIDYNLVSSGMSEEPAEPKWDENFGAALFDFYCAQRDRKWTGRVVSDSSAALASNIRSAEWRSFYKTWWQQLHTA